MPKVTVIVPCYNHSRYVAQCVISLCTQSFPVNIHVIDDGSTDDSPRVLEDLKHQYPISVHRQSNQGLLATLNWAVSTLDLGDYVCFLASDDYVPPQRFEKQAQFMKDHPEIALSYGNYTEVDSEGHRITEVQCIPPRNDIFGELLISNFIAAPTTIIKSSVLKGLGGFDPEFKIEDWNLWLRIAQHYPIAHIDANLAYYRIHSSNTHRDIEFMRTETGKVVDQFSHEKNYTMAKSLIKVKYIAKSFKLEPLHGLKLMFQLLSAQDYLNLVRCFALQKGPFRKFRFYYLLNKALHLLSYRPRI